MPKFNVIMLVFRKGSMLDPEAVQVLKFLREQFVPATDSLRMARCISFEIEMADAGAVQAMAEKACQNPKLINPVSERVTIEIGEVRPGQKQPAHTSSPSSGVPA